MKLSETDKVYWNLCHKQAKEWIETNSSILKPRDAILCLDAHIQAMADRLVKLQPDNGTAEHFYRLADEVFNAIYKSQTNAGSSRE